MIAPVAIRLLRGLPRNARASAAMSDPTPEAAMRNP